MDQENRKMRVDWGGILLISTRLLPTRGRTPAVTQDVPKQVPVGFCRIQFHFAPGIVSSRLCWLNFRRAGSGV